MDASHARDHGSGADAELADPATRRGLTAGLVQSLFYLVAFGSVLGLAVVLDVVTPATWPDRVSLLALVVALAVGFGAGAAWVVGAYANDPLRRVASDPRGRFGVIVGWCVALVALLAAVPQAGVVAGLAFVAGRVAAHAWLFVAG